MVFVPELRHADRDDRDTLQLRQKLFKGFQRVFQILSVVPPLAKDNLPIQADAGILQPHDLRHNIPREAVMQHLFAKLGIHRVEGDVDRLQMVQNNAVDVMIRHVGHRDIVALQKGQSCVIVMKVQGIPHSLRHLVDKAEDTMIPAGPVFAHQPSAEPNPQIFIRIFFDLKFPFLSVRLADHDKKLFVIAKIPIVENILDFFSIHRDEYVSGFNIQFFRDASGIDRFYFMKVFHLIPFRCHFHKK